MLACARACWRALIEVAFRVCPAQRIVEEDSLAQNRMLLREEESKREGWKVEAARRKHNYVPFAVALLKAIVDTGGREVIEKMVARGKERYEVAKKADGGLKSGQA